jgi:hypothetical protein
MYPNPAALGKHGTVRPGGLFLTAILALAALVPGCKDAANPQTPTTPPTGFTLRGVVIEGAGGDSDPVGAVLVEITSGPSSGMSTTTDALGRFTLLNLTGQLNLRFSREGWVPTGATVNMTADVFLNVTIAREDDPDPPDPVFALSGIVRRGQGDMDPIGGAVVEVLDGERAGDSSTTDALGRFTLSGLSGEVTVRASRAGFDDVEKVIEVAEDTMAFFVLMTPPEVSMCVDLDDEEVHITNDDMNNELVLTDWILREVTESNQFLFVEERECRAAMNGFTLAPGATVIITSGDGPEHDPPNRIAGWCDFVWDNDGDTARLFRPFPETLVVEAIGSFAACGGN